ncbi:protein kinase domain-containing protein [Streptomyces apocyni]|uniref:protein kinase domain-containing protein n=1 Tax=Streptomyces apocyni TaxID=2654677 RepID=UPI0018D04A63|nr:DUF4328 domain-containing protein [Streptomyces apocyni]
MWPLDEADPLRIGPYRLLARLGEGGMGTVFLAEGSGGERVALKSIRQGYADEPGFRARFVREIETAGMVRTEGIARVVDSEPGGDGQRPWVATEFVPSLSLQQLVTAQGPLPARSVGALAVGLGRALEAVHAAGLIHRDVKPSNILLTVEGPRLIDFGVARLVDASTSGALTRTGASVGSPGYMSPEQVLGRSLSPASDVFGLGGVLVFATTGELPFPVEDTANQHALMFAVVQQDPSHERVPAELRDIVADCLDKEPGGRPDAATLVERLGAYAAVLDGGAGAARDAEPWLPARALAEVARISGRAVTQGEWRPRGGGAGAGSSPGAGSGDGSASGDHVAEAAPAAPAQPAQRPGSPPPPPDNLPYVPTVTAPAGPPPQAPPRAPGAPPTPQRAEASPPRAEASPQRADVSPQLPRPARAQPPQPARAQRPRPHYVRKEPIPGSRPIWTPPPRASAAPPPSAASPWVTRQAVLRSPESLATVLSWLFGLYIAFKCVAIVIVQGFVNEIGGWQRANQAQWTDVYDLVENMGTLVMLDSLALIAIYVVMLMWFWRVRGNAEVFAPGEQRYSPGMAIGGWFIPVGSWIIPGKIAFDIWYASLRDRDRGRTTDRGWVTTRRFPGRHLLSWWWGCTVVFSIAFFVLAFFPDALESAVDYPKGTHFDRMLTVNQWAIFLNLLCIPGAALSIAVIRRLTELQEIRAGGR